MAQYRLKPGQERFQVCDGPCANRSYVPGVIYEEIPAAEAKRFEEIFPATPPPATPKKSKTAEVDNA